MFNISIEKIENENIDKIAGPALGAVPIATATSLISKKPMLMIRKEKKSYGTSKQIEGELLENDNVIVDTHCTINTPSGFLPGLPIWVLEELQPDLFILIEANPDEIIYRRLNDETRARDVQRAKDIQLHQKYLYAFLFPVLVMVQRYL